jgi:Tol biopolymer transport system component
MRRHVALLVAVVLTLLGSGSAVAVAAHGASNGQITFGRYDPELDDFSIWAANPDGTGERRLTFMPSYFSRWSPDGQRIAFDFVADDGEHIATMAPDGSDMQQLTTGTTFQEVPRWSPDGSSIAYDGSTQSFDDPDFSISIWTVDADGSDVSQITSDAFDVEPVFSPDGRWIAFGRITGESELGQLESLMVVRTDGSGLREVIPPRAGLEHPDWSPDGRWISFNIAPESGDAPNSGSVLVVHPHGQGLHVLRAASKRLRFYKPVWSPDGRKLLVGCFDTAAEIEQLCVVDAHGGTPTAIVAGTSEGGVNFPAWGTFPAATP